MITIKVDGKTLFKGTVGEWIAKPPDMFRNAINPSASPSPWMKAILIAMADAVSMDEPRLITANTRLKGVKRGWSVEVVTP
jgi:hypothetical protein